MAKITRADVNALAKGRPIKLTRIGHSVLVTPLHFIPLRSRMNADFSLTVHCLPENHQDTTRSAAL